jgi:3-phosphoshikimate 1-carboxyvinyltransferase
LVADDTEAMLSCLRAVGVEARVEDARTMSVRGSGGKLRPALGSLDARLSGTTARFMAPVVAAAGDGHYRLDGDAPLRARPMGVMADALRSLGTRLVAETADHLPLGIWGGARGGHVALPGHISSQFLSGLLLAGPAFAEGVEVELTSDLVSAPYVDLTLAVMRSFGVEVEGDAASGYRVRPAVYESTDYTVEPDASAASYFFAAAAITGGRVRVEGLGLDALQGDVAFVDLLERMGCEVIRSADAIEVRGPGQLHGIDADLRDRSDTAQTLAIVAVFADSPTTVTGIGFIRRKETDRIAAVVTELARCGIKAHEDEDGFTVEPGRPTPARIETYQDHRMAMSFALLGLVVPGIEIADPTCVAKTYPNYFADLDQLRR